MVLVFGRALFTSGLLRMTSRISSLIFERIKFVALIFFGVKVAGSHIHGDAGTCSSSLRHSSPTPACH